MTLRGSPAVICGNGLVEFGEQCDDGDAAGGDGCSATCQIEVVCGDGLIAPAEQCDDGNTAGGDGCSATCQVETTPELEPNNTFADAAASALQITSDTTIQGSIAIASDRDLRPRRLLADRRYGIGSVANHTRFIYRLQVSFR